MREAREALGCASLAINEEKFIKYFVSQIIIVQISFLKKPSHWLGYAIGHVFYLKKNSPWVFSTTLRVTYFSLFVTVPKPYCAPAHLPFKFSEMTGFVMGTWLQKDASEQTHDLVLDNMLFLFYSVSTKNIIFLIPKEKSVWMIAGHRNMKVHHYQVTIPGGISKPNWKWAVLKCWEYGRCSSVTWLPPAGILWGSQTSNGTWNCWLLNLSQF